MAGTIEQVSTAFSDRSPSLDRVEDSEQRFRKLLEALPDAILVHSENKIVFVNPFCVRLLAAEGPEQLLGKDIFVERDLNIKVRSHFEVGVHNIRNLKVDALCRSRWKAAGRQEWIERGFRVWRCRVKKPGPTVKEVNAKSRGRVDSLYSFVTS